MTYKNKFEKPELSVDELSKALYETSLKLQNTNKKLMEQEQERLAFYANISHDLRSPVTAISNSIEYLLTHENLTMEEVHHTLQIMHKRTEYMKQLINNIFLLSSLESSDEKVHKEPIDIFFFLEDYFYMCEADSRYKNVQLKLDIPENDCLILEMDPVLMQRVFDNLFANALKYNDKQPEITLSAAIKDSMLTISVSDNGLGIPIEHLPYIFNRSYMADKSRTPDATSSSGFGLSIVKTIVEHHNGTISCESSPGIGSTFIITFKIQGEL